MEPFAVFMLLVTCSPDLSECREISAPTAAYNHIADCRIDLAARANEISDPGLKGTCITFDVSLLYADAEIVWDVTAEGGLVAGAVAITPDEGTDIAHAEMFPVDAKPQTVELASNSELITDRVQ